jgi:hypothetical protein
VRDWDVHGRLRAERLQFFLVGAVLQAPLGSQRVVFLLGE